MRRAGNTTVRNTQSGLVAISRPVDFASGSARIDADACSATTCQRSHPRQSARIHGLPRYRARALFAIAALALVGCADSGTVQVAGNVTVDDEKVVQGTIGFFPVDGQGPSAEAVIDDGKYAASMAPGKKKVVIHGYRQVGEKFPWGKKAQSMPVLEEIVPKDYNANSSLTADVQADNAELDFKLDASRNSPN